MRLILKEKDGSTKEFHFAEGPISIGRAVDSKILLPDRTVSRQHAVIFCDDDGKWILEDLDSTSKTYLNDKAVHKAEIKAGDCIRIAEFIIEFGPEEQVEAKKEMLNADTSFDVEAGLATPQHETLVRKPDASHAPAMRLAARRLTDFSQATEAICGAGSLEELLVTLLNTMLKQFSAFHVWCALREQPSGPMTYHAGKRRDGKAVDESEIKLMDKIEQAVVKGQSMVLPRVAAGLEEKERIRSALIAPIIRPAGCYGILYVDNAMVHKHYSLSDLDYLMLVAMHTAAILKKFLGGQ
jgi:pSer/pThr/pTyr-binding forkhead associated (FHA) protein